MSYFDHARVRINNLIAPKTCALAIVDGQCLIIIRHESKPYHVESFMPDGMLSLNDDELKYRLLLPRISLLDLKAAQHAETPLWYWA